MIGLLPRPLGTALFIGAHCDDIEIGCGATLLRLLKDYPAFRETARASASGIVREAPPEKSALEVSPEEREREFQARWDIGGFAIGGAFIDLLINADANATHQSVINVMEAARLANILQITFATQSTANK